MIICYNNDKVIVGMSEVMYKGKWYRVLYKTVYEDYLVIEYKKEYVKIQKEEIEDCKYHNTIIEDDTIRLMKGENLNQQIMNGRRYIKEKCDEILLYAIINDCELYSSNGVISLFKNNRLVKYTLEDNGYCEYYEWFDSFIKSLMLLKPSKKRIGINKIMIEYLDSSYYSDFNKILISNSINNDNDVYKCNQETFIKELMELTLS